MYWVAHPALVAVAMAEFNKYMPTNQPCYSWWRNHYRTRFSCATGYGHWSRYSKNINVGILYIESWLRGHGAVAFIIWWKMLLPQRFQERRFGNG
jgi:malate synthase